MAMNKVYASYQDVIEHVNPGDVVAFVGNNKFCNLIKADTDYPISHLGVIVSSTSKNAGDHFKNVKIIESGLINGFDGVSISDFRDRYIEYFGAIFILPLRKMFTERLLSSYDGFYNFVKKQEGKPYDVPHCIQLGLRESSFLDSMKNWIVDVNAIRNISIPTDGKSWFCSNLVAACLSAGNVIPSNVNPSDMTPKAVCTANLYKDTYWQIKGDPLFDIPEYNTINFNKQ